MSKRWIGLSAKLNDYILSVSLREPEVLLRLREETAALPMAGMQGGPEQGQFMALMAKLLNAKQYLEIRTFTGYNPPPVGLAPPLEGPILRCDHNPANTARA